MQFRILGPLEVLDDGREVPLGPAKERAVLAFLLLHAGSVVSRTQLIEGLWGESPPPTAAKAVNNYVSHLRRTLSRDGVEAILTRHPGYLLQLDEDTLDAARFQQLAAAAREHERAGELEAGATQMREALALWRGQVLAGIELEGDALDELSRLEELRFAAQLDVVDYELALGRHEQLMGELERLVAEHPLDERLRGQLILALYRSGRQAEALQTYSETRKTLIENLGIEPGVPLQHLERDILNHDPSLAAPAGAAPKSQPRAPRRRVRLMLMFALLAILLLAASLVAAGVWRHSRSSRSASAVPPHSLVEIDPRTNALTRIPMDWTPSALGLRANEVWALNRDAQIVARVDPHTQSVQPVGVGVVPTSVGIGAGSVWVLSSDQGDLLRIEPLTGTLTGEKRIPFGAAPSTSVGDPTGIVAGEHSVWIEDGFALSRIDPATSKVSRRVLGNNIDGIATGLGSIWAIRGTPATLLRIDPRTMAVTAKIPISQRRGPTAPFPIGVAVGADAVWVLNGNTGTVTRVDPKLDAPVDTVPRVSLNATRIAAGAGAVWVADVDRNALLRIDPTTHRVRTIELGGTPKALAAGRSGVWVAVDSS